MTLCYPSKQGSWKIFDCISVHYDKINKILSFGMDVKWRERAAKHLPKKKELKLLDLASGTGAQIIACFETGASIESAVGIDLSKDMLRVARHKLATKTYGKKVSFLHGDAKKLPFPKTSFDAATCSFGIRNFSNPLATLKEMHRILKPQGRCIVLEFSLPAKPWKFFHLFYLRHLLPHIGAFFSKNPFAYRYLSETIETFPYGSSFCCLMNAAGLQNVRTIPIAWGAVTIYVGERP